MQSAVRDDNRLHVRSRTARGSGLGIGSRHTATKTRLRRFSPRSVGWDRLARKGALYTQIARQDGGLELDVVKPDVVVYLQASAETLMERIARRNRSFEKDMDKSYIERLNDAYNHHFFHYTETDLLQRILSHRQGTMYYAPLEKGGPV